MERQYGVFLDENYKQRFIDLKKSKSYLDIRDLAREAAKMIKQKYNTTGVDYSEILSRRPKKELSFFDKLKNFFSI